MVLYISEKFHNNISNGCFALYISEKFHNNISNGFQLTEQTQVHGINGYVQCSKGSTSKSKQTRVTVHVVSSRLIAFYICVKF